MSLEDTEPASAPGAWAPPGAPPPRERGARTAAGSRGPAFAAARRSPASGGARPLRAIARFAIDWFPVAFVLFAYDEIHNRLGPWLPAAHTFPQLRLDAWLGGGVVPTLRLQHAFYDAAHPGWWDFVALAIYTSHFVLSPAIALVLWLTDRHRFLKFLTWFVAVTTAGYVTYALFPAVPPWLASQHGDLAPTHRLARELWSILGGHRMAEMFSGTNVYANDVAAIPSLHAAYPLLIAMFFWRTASPAMRLVLALYVVLMPFVLVYGAEHYVLDILLGWLYAALGVWALRRYEPRPGDTWPGAIAAVVRRNFGAAPSARPRRS